MRARGRIVFALAAASRKGPLNSGRSCFGRSIQWTFVFQLLFSGITTEKGKPNTTQSTLNQLTTVGYSELRARLTVLIVIWLTSLMRLWVVLRDHCCPRVALKLKTLGLRYLFINKTLNVI